MRTIVLFFALLITSSCILSACGGIRPSAHFIINNESEASVPMTVSITQKDHSSPAHLLTQSMQPGIQQIPAGKFKKGMYQVTASVNGDSPVQTKSLSLDADRWIIINYINSDSLGIQRKYGYVDPMLMKKMGDRYAGIDIFSENRLPPTLMKYPAKTSQPADH